MRGVGPLGRAGGGLRGVCCPGKVCRVSAARPVCKRLPHGSLGRRECAYEPSPAAPRGLQPAAAGWSWFAARVAGRLPPARLSPSPGRRAPPRVPTARFLGAAPGHAGVARASPASVPFPGLAAGRRAPAPLRFTEGHGHHGSAGVAVAYILDTSPESTFSEPRLGLRTASRLAGAWSETEARTPFGRAGRRGRLSCPLVPEQGAKSKLSSHAAADDS